MYEKNPKQFKGVIEKKTYGPFHAALGELI